MTFEEEIEELLKLANTQNPSNHQIHPDSDYVPEYMRPFTPVPYELPEIPGMRLEKDHPLWGGRHVVVRMRNGWVVSIINHWGAYGGLEVGFYPPYSDHMGAPPFWDDVVMGYLDQQKLVEVLAAVHQLPTKERDEGTTY